MNGLTQTVTLRDQQKEVLQAAYNAVLFELAVPTSGYPVILPKTTDATTLFQLERLGLLKSQARESGIEVTLTPAGFETSKTLAIQSEAVAPKAPQPGYDWEAD